MLRWCTLRSSMRSSSPFPFDGPSLSGCCGLGVSTFARPLSGVPQWRPNWRRSGRRKTGDVRVIGAHRPARCGRRACAHRNQPGNSRSTVCLLQKVNRQLQARHLHRRRHMAEFRLRRPRDRRLYPTDRRLACQQQPDRRLRPLCKHRRPPTRSALHEPDGSPRGNPHIAT